MTTYTIIPVEDGSGFHVGVTGSDGARQTMLGFTSILEAEEWILQDKRLDAGANGLDEGAYNDRAHNDRAFTA
jgi:hypothetical protein